MALDILIVDDERDIRDLVAGVLSDEGYSCRTAADSTSALAAVTSVDPAWCCSTCGSTVRRWTGSKCSMRSRRASRNCR